jgi:hypothetical protein
MATSPSPKTPKPAAINTSFNSASHNNNAGSTPFSHTPSSPSRPTSSTSATPRNAHLSPTSPSSAISFSKSATATVLAAISSSPQLAAAVVKEYLTAKGLTRSLEAFRLEHLQFQPQTVSSRQELAKQLGIAKLVQQNKSSGMSQ